MAFPWPLSRRANLHGVFVFAVAILSCVFCQFPPIPKFYTFKAGLSYNLTCPGDLTKNYTFTFLLQKENKLSVVQQDEDTKQVQSTLVMLKVVFQDAGQYFCEIRNQQGERVGQRIFIGIVHVRKAEKKKFEIFPETYTSIVDAGVTFKFTCIYDGPNMPMTWLRLRRGSAKKKPISRENIVVKNDDGKSIEVYTIKSVSKDNEGTYTCQVNKTGQIRTTKPRVLQVRRYQKPEFTDVRQVVIVVQGDDVNIPLEVEGVPFPNITCLREGSVIIKCSKKEIQNYTSGGDNPCKNGDYELTALPGLVINNVLLSKHHGNYTCSAKNIAGSTNVTFVLNVSVRPVISIANSDTFHEILNKRGHVKCLIREANPRPNVTWFRQHMKRGQDKPSPNKWKLSKYKSRLLTVTRGKYESILDIPKNVKQSFYRCNVTNKYGSDSRIYKFLRNAKDREPIVVSPSSEQVVNEGGTFTAECRVTETFPDDIVFFNEETKKVIENDSRTELTLRQDKSYRYLTMTITNLTLNDSGTYRCTEEIKLTNKKAFATLTVKALRPALIHGLLNRTVDSSIVRSVVLFCNVSGNPHPTVTWFQHGERLVPNLLSVQNCRSTRPGYYYYKDDTYRTKLVVCNPAIKHNGAYTCLAKNQLNNVSRKAYLDVLARPTILEPKSVMTPRIHMEEKYQLTCKASGNPVPLVQWIKTDRDRPATKASVGFSSFRIDKMDKSYAGNYTCKAWNRLGTAERQLLELEIILPDIEGRGSSEGMGTGSIIGVVIAVLIIVLIIAMLACLYNRRQRRKLLFYKHQYFLRAGEYTVDPSLTLNEQSLNLPYDSDWEFPFERLVIGDRLGAGAFGEVYKAEAMGILALNARDKSGIANKRRSKLRRSLRASQRPKKRGPAPDIANATVAVKTLKGHATESEIRDLAAELKLMIHLGEHKNIVNLLGACTTGRKLYVILEFCPHGNLLSFLRTKRDIYNSTWVKEVFDPEQEFTLIDLVGAAFQVAKGMEFLASRKLIHRDLAARNILVGEEYVMKISDFGLARDIYKDDVYVKTSSGLLPVKWMAIESLFDRVYTHQSDVWSFGVLLWEMMTLGGTPYPNLPAEELLDFLNNGKRMPQPSKCPLEVYTIMRDCWVDEPEQRPTFTILAEHLGRILEKRLEKVNPYIHVAATPEEIESFKEKELLVSPKPDYYLQPLLLANKQNNCQHTVRALVHYCLSFKKGTNEREFNVYHSVLAAVFKRPPLEPFENKEAVLRYDANAPLPTPPTDMPTPTYSNVNTPVFDAKPGTSNLRAAGSYELLREDAKDTVKTRPRASLDNESGIGLDDINGRHREVTDGSKQVETVV